MKKYIHVIHTYMEASGFESKICALKTGEHSFLYGTGGWLRVSKLSEELTVLDPLVPSDFAQLLEEADSVTIVSLGLALSQMNAAIPRKLLVSKRVIAASACSGVFSGSSKLELFLGYCLSR